MESEKLIGYSIEVNNGKLVVTVEGVFAEGVLGRVKEQLKKGRGLAAILKATPIRYLSRLASREVSVVDDTASSPDGDLDLASIFSQQVDQHYQEFSDQLSRLESEKKGKVKNTRKGRTSKRKASKRSEATEAQ